MRTIQWLPDTPWNLIFHFQWRTAGDQVKLLGPPIANTTVHEPLTIILSKFSTKIKSIRSAHHLPHLPHDLLHCCNPRLGSCQGLKCQGLQHSIKHYSSVEQATKTKMRHSVSHSSGHATCHWYYYIIYILHYITIIVAVLSVHWELSQQVI